MPYDSKKHGRAEYNRFMQITADDYAAVLADEGDENIDLLNQRFAQLVYQVNPSPISLSGDISLGATIGIDGTGDVSVSGGALSVTDEQTHTTLNAIYDNVVSRLSVIVRYNGNYTYVMTASIGGVTSGESVWRVSRVYDDGITTHVQWANGNDNFVNAASAYLDLTYTF